MTGSASVQSSPVALRFRWFQNRYEFTHTPLVRGTVSAKSPNVPLTAN